MARNRRTGDTTPGARRHCRLHEDCVLSLAFSPDGATLASGGADGLMRVWPVEGLREKLTELRLGW